MVFLPEQFTLNRNELLDLPLGDRNHFAVTLAVPTFVGPAKG